MKLMHLADLHIGKRVNGFSMISDQEYILRQILEVMDREQPDAMLIAGDVYDKTVPSAEAVELLDWFLTALVSRNVPVLLISGNHDSPERLAFASRMLKKNQIYIVTSPEESGTSVVLEDVHGKVFFYLLPYIKPAVIRHLWGLSAEENDTCNQVVKECVTRMQIDPGERNVLLAHQFVTGAATCESEELWVGGLDQVEWETFRMFDYVALGHLHSPQSVGKSCIRYSGSPLKYSFSETRQEKSVTMVELEEKGACQVRVIPLVPCRDWRQVKGQYAELTLREHYLGQPIEDYMQVTLTDEEDVPDALAKLRTIYPHIMKLVYDNTRTRTTVPVGSAEQKPKQDPAGMLEEFYKLQNNRPMSEKQRAYATEAICQIWEEEV